MTKSALIQKPRTKFREHLEIIRRLRNSNDPDLKNVFLGERMVLSLLCVSLLCTPWMWIRFFYLEHRDDRVHYTRTDAYILMRTALAIAVLLSYGWWEGPCLKFLFAILAIVFLNEIFSNVFSTIFLRNFFRSTISYNRSLISLGLNFIEYTAWFAVLYLVFNGIFEGNTQVNRASTAWYFSVVTAATVGYGDITPRHYGRVFAMIEIAGSIGFMAAAVAYFVGGIDRRNAGKETEN